MSNPLRTSEDYELFIYRLPEQFKSIRQSTLTLVRPGLQGYRQGQVSDRNSLKSLESREILASLSWLHQRLDQTLFLQLQRRHGDQGRLPRI